MIKQTTHNWVGETTKYYIADPELRDGEGRKIRYKVRRDSKGLYITRFGMIGRLEKKVRVVDCGEWRDIRKVRQVAYYEEAVH